MRVSIPILAFCCLAACADSDVQRAEDRGTRLITFANGQTIRAEIRTRPEDILRGAMFRDSMPADRGIILLHKEDAPRPAFLYQVRFPLDIVWFSEKSVIVELARNVPPCPEGTRATQCPVYGASVRARTVLLLPAGAAARCGLEKGLKVDL